MKREREEKYQRHCFKISTLLCIYHNQHVKIMYIYIHTDIHGVLVMLIFVFLGTRENILT